MHIVEQIVAARLCQSAELCFIKNLQNIAVIHDVIDPGVDIVVSKVSKVQGLNHGCSPHVINHGWLTP